MVRGYLADRVTTPDGRTGVIIYTDFKTGIVTVRFDDGKQAQYHVKDLE